MSKAYRAPSSYVSHFQRLSLNFPHGLRAATKPTTKVYLCCISLFLTSSVKSSTCEVSLTTTGAKEPTKKCPRRLFLRHVHASCGKISSLLSGCKVVTVFFPPTATIRDILRVLSTCLTHSPDDDPFNLVWDLCVNLMGTKACEWTTSWTLLGRFSSVPASECQTADQRGFMVSVRVVPGIIWGYKGRYALFHAAGRWTTEQQTRGWRGVRKSLKDRTGILLLLFSIEGEVRWYIIIHQIHNRSLKERQTVGCAGFLSTGRAPASFGTQSIYCTCSDCSFHHTGCRTARLKKETQ